MNEIQKLKVSIPIMNENQKETQKQITLASIKKESVKCHRKGMSLEAILAPAYKNSEFMEVLSLLGIDKDGLKEYVVECIKEYDLNKDVEQEHAIGTTLAEKMEMTKKGARLAMLKTANFVVKKETIWKEFNNFINSLKQETFDHNVVDLIRSLNFGKESCSEFKTTKEQTDNAIVRWPRLGQYHAALFEWIKQCRNNNGYET